MLDVSVRNSLCLISSLQERANLHDQILRPGFIYKLEILNAGCPYAAPEIQAVAIQTGFPLGFSVHQGYPSCPAEMPATFYNLLLQAPFFYS